MDNLDHSAFIEAQILDALERGDIDVLEALEALEEAGIEMAWGAVA